ncbi:hypothetical protein [Chitinimonas koreensis]|uniref:hypothetical protein n=1 Tax=Chitinimonas koreensis TaxID=356302 RepID=UPI00048EC9B5|nr:hypothetical protein [Chitinimonas koreensis]
MSATKLREWVEAQLGRAPVQYDAVQLAGQEWWVHIWERSGSMELTHQVVVGGDRRFYKVSDGVDSPRWEYVVKPDDTTRPDDSFYVRRGGYAPSLEEAAACCLAVVERRELVDGVCWFEGNDDCWTARHDSEEIEVRRKQFVTDCVLPWHWERKHASAKCLAALVGGHSDGSLGGKEATLEDARRAALRAPADFRAACAAAAGLEGSDLFRAGRQAALVEIEAAIGRISAQGGA